MNRCNFRTLLPILASAMLLAVLAQGTAYAQSDGNAVAAQANKRQFPKAALRGEMTVIAPPEILMDGRADRLSPGARIRDTQNQFALSGSYLNRSVAVNYVRDISGLVSEVWVLTDEEAREKRRGLFDTIINYTFGSTPPPADYSNTPYNQLPAYGK